METKRSRPKLKEKGNYLEDLEKKWIKKLAGK